MYEKHFGLRQRPFRATPDSSRYYPSTVHEDALTALQQGIADEEGILLLTGEPGMGKTLLCHCLLQRTGEECRSAFLTNTHLPDRVALLQTLAYELGLSHEDRSEQALRLSITDDLLRQCGDGSSTLLLVDEAHHLGFDALEELRLLANLESGEGRALHVILAGQLDVHRTLAHPALASLRQRLAVRAHLEPLTPNEAADYVLHHLRMATDRPERVMDGEALELLARGTRGVPRLLSQAAHRSLTLACQADSECVDAEAVTEALLALGLEAGEPMHGEELLRQTA